MTETTSNDCPSCAGVPAHANPDEGGIANAKNNNNPVGNIAIAAGGLFFVTFFGQVAVAQLTSVDIFRLES